MLLVIRGLERHSEAWNDFTAKPPNAFLSVQEAQEIANGMDEGRRRIDEINGEIGPAEPIVIWANYQQLRIVDNALDVWSRVQRREDRQGPTCAWTLEGDRLWWSRFPGDYPEKARVDALHARLERARAAVAPCPAPA